MDLCAQDTPYLYAWYQLVR
jgi:tetratricopeptide (TPR) repeat protein